MSLYEVSENIAYDSPVLPAQQIGHVDGYFKDLYCENLNVATGGGSGLEYQATAPLVPTEVPGYYSLYTTNASVIDNKVRYNTSSVIVLCTMTNIDTRDWITINNDDGIPFVWGEWYPVLMGYTLPGSNDTTKSFDFRQEPVSEGKVQIYLDVPDGGALTFSCKVLMFNRRLGW